MINDPKIAKRIINKIENIDKKILEEVLSKMENEDTDTVLLYVEELEKNNKTKDKKIEELELKQDKIIEALTDYGFDDLCCECCCECEKDYNTLYSCIKNKL